MQPAAHHSAWAPGFPPPGKWGYEDQGRVGVSSRVPRVTQEADAEMELGLQGGDREARKPAANVRGAGGQDHPGEELESAEPLARARQAGSSAGVPAPGERDGGPEAEVCAEGTHSQRLAAALLLPAEN